MMSTNGNHMTESEMIDYIDLMVDDFRRIKACPGATSEIKQLCDRAITTTRQNVPVIAQRDLAQERGDRLMVLGYAYRAALHAEYSALTPPNSAPCQASMMRGGDRCECSECRRSRYLELEARAEALGVTR